MRLSDLPNMIFIVGAPRCGTTTLAGFLRQHPDICFPFVKEPHFFAQYDLTKLSEADARELTEREFVERFFSHCAGTAKAAGVDGSVSYLYIPERLVPALAMWPDAKFVVALRDPMTMLPSLHQRLRFTGDETISDFQDAWAAIPDRAIGKRVPRSCLEPRWLRYDEAGRFGTYVERLFEAVGRERCFVSLFDDLVADPQGQYRAMMNFIGLPPFEGTRFKRERESRGFRYGWLQRLLKRPPAAARAYLAGEHFRQRERNLDDDESSTTETILSIRKRLLRWNRAPLEKRPIPVAVQQDIRERLSGEIAHLSRLLGRDLSHWLQVRDGRSG